jgi:hypothetical protein
MSLVREKDVSHGYGVGQIQAGPKDNMAMTTETEEITGE